MILSEFYRLPLRLEQGAPPVDLLLIKRPQAQVCYVSAKQAVDLLLSPGTAQTTFNNYLYPLRPSFPGGTLTSTPLEKNVGCTGGRQQVCQSAVLDQPASTQGSAGKVWRFQAAVA